MIGYPQNLRRREASQYLRERYNIRRAPSTLAKLAVVGGGPSFRHAGRVPLYPIPELDRWAESIMSPLRSSTSDCGATTAAPSRPAPVSTSTCSGPNPRPAARLADGNAPMPDAESAPAVGRALTLPAGR